MTRVNIELDSELHKKAKLNSLLQNKTLIQYIHEALEEKLERDNAFPNSLKPKGFQRKVRKDEKRK